MKIEILTGLQSPAGNETYSPIQVSVVGAVAFGELAFRKRLPRC